MQKEMRNKTVTYGLSAVLLAALLTALIYNFGVQPFIQQDLSSLKTFSSYEELESFLREGMAQAKQAREGGVFLDTSQASNALPAETRSFASSKDYSGTNIQVAGVDEADIVKTDGEYLYLFSNGNVYILRAYPPEQAQILSKIPVNSTYNAQIYVNGDKLAILEQRQYYYRMGIEPFPAQPDAVAKIYPSPLSEETFVKVYDITNRANPVLTRTVISNGTLGGSRMIGDYIYAATSQPSTFTGWNETDFTIMLPRITTGDKTEEIQPTEIRYISVSDISYRFTTIIAVNIIDDTQEPTHETLVTGTSSIMYVSESNMYLTAPNSNIWFMPMEEGIPKEETLIYRIRLDKEKMIYEAQGNITGHVLNQFSMDEYNGYFRIATTTGWGQTSINNVFVLDMGLDIVGTLTDIALGETIQSARFMGQRCYLVTFRQIDPFFVIDLSSPTDPTVLGYLKIPGFSRYLHPYDENYIIGIGQQDNKVKLSLFDATNVSAPVEAVPPYIVQGSWSYTSVLDEHKAFLFDKSKQLLALPISINWVQFTDNAYYYQEHWQGEYVFNLSLSSGFILRGSVTHQNSSNPYDSNYYVNRALYIENVLYTISNKKVKMNSLADLALIKEIELD